MNGRVVDHTVRQPPTVEEVFGQGGSSAGDGSANEDEMREAQAAERASIDKMDKSGGKHGKCDVVYPMSHTKEVYKKVGIFTCDAAQASQFTM